MPWWMWVLVVFCCLAAATFVATEVYDAFFADL
jgi:hypothetical protein